jgi:acyl-CoA reductase-like NAD-dependent aldehyde dehydrogenase
VSGATAAEIRERLARLRRAGVELRRRPARETLAALARVLELWRDPRSRFRRELEAELPKATGFSPAVVREGLARGLAPFSGEALCELARRELGPPEWQDGAGPRMVAGFETTAVVLAGAIPMPTLLSLLAPLALRSPALAKPAASDPLTARLVARSLAEVDAELATGLELAEFRGADSEAMGALLEADCIVATGSDATLAEIAARVAPPRRLVGYGHRLSLAAAGEPALRGPALDALAAGLALDAALWDQQGCLSPLWVYAVAPGPEPADRLAEALARALAEVEARLPRGAPGPAAAAAIAQERAGAELRAAAGQRVALHASRGSEWSVVREGDAQPRPAPLHRFLRVHPVADASELLRAVRPFGPQLAGVALAGFGSEEPALARALVELGASRLCRPGALQAPPLGWPRDGRGVLAPLARLACFDPPGES